MSALDLAGKLGRDREVRPRRLLSRLVLEAHDSAEADDAAASIHDAPNSAASDVSRPSRGAWATEFEHAESPQKTIAGMSAFDAMGEDRIDDEQSLRLLREAFADASAAVAVALEAHVAPLKSDPVYCEAAIVAGYPPNPYTARLEQLHRREAAAETALVASAA